MEFIMDNYYLGSDASKGYADFVIINSNKEAVEENFQLDDTHEGHCKLYEILENFFHNHPNCTMYVAMESTGGYENNWYKFFINCASCFNLKVTRLNPYGVSKDSEAGLKRNKTDKISARNVAEYMITHPENITYQAYDPLAPLKEQWNYIEILNKQKVQFLNLFEIKIYKANTELIRYCKNGVPHWLLKVVAKYPTAELLAEADLKELTAIPYVSLKKSEIIIARAQNSVASSSGTNIERQIKDLVKEILDKESEIEKQKNILEKDTKIIPHQIKLLKSLKGIGTYSAVGLLILIGDVKNFSSAKKLACFFGLHPKYKKSGDGSWGFHMSKKGNAKARKILYMVCLSAIKSNPYIIAIYHKNLKKGMKRKAAIGVCMHKILRIVYGMLKHNKEFDSKIDKENREKQNSNSKNVQKDRDRRYQELDSNAPISRRQTKKRNEKIQNQSVENYHSEIRNILYNFAFNLN